MFKAPGRAWARESQKHREGSSSLPVYPYSPALPRSSWKAQHRVQSQRRKLGSRQKAFNRMAELGLIIRAQFYQVITLYQALG